MIFVHYCSILDRFQDFFDVRFNKVHHQEENLLVFGTITLDSLLENDIVKLRGENVVLHGGEFSHDMDLSDKLFQIVDVIEHPRHQLDSVWLTVGLADALHNFAIRTLTELFLYTEVLFDEFPFRSFFLVRFIDLFHEFLWKN